MSEELEHSKRGPSGAAAWRRCHGKLNAEAGLPERVGYAAAEGTIFHMYAAWCVEHGFSPYDFPTGDRWEQDGHVVEYDREMQDSMMNGLQWLAENVEPGDLVFVERRVDISPWCGPDEFGTADVTILKIARLKIINFDWKYGKGVTVSPLKNDQQYLYSLGAWNTFAAAYFEGVDPADIEVEFYIEQPRAPGGGGSWITNMQEVLDEGESIREDAKATRDPFAPRTPGEKQCEFCRASGNCREQAQWLLEGYGKSFDEIADEADLGIGPVLPDEHALDPVVRSFVVLHWKTFKKFVDACHALILADFRAGREPPLLKAVKGRPGHRKYIDSMLDEAREKAIELVGEDKAIVSELASPPEMEKLLGKKRWKETMAKYVMQAPAKPKLVALEAKGEPITDYASMFDSLLDEEDDETE